MKPLCCLLMILLAIACKSYGQPYNQNEKYSPAQLKYDLQCLRDSLGKNHPNLYMYTAKPVFDAFFDSLANSYTKPLTGMEFYNTITLLNGKIKNGHTMFLPGDSAMDYFNKACRFFPFYVQVVDNKLYVNMNCSSDTAIPPGAEILIINGKSAAGILQYLLARQVRDGYNNTYPVWILNNYFKEYYGFAFGHPDMFAVTYKTGSLAPKTTVMHALPKDSIKYLRNARYASRVVVNNQGNGITLQINNNNAYGVLAIKSFEGEKLQTVYQQNFKTAVDAAFKQIKASRIKQLVIDLRDNQGGDFENGQLLLSYLLAKPFKLLEKGAATEMVKPQANHFSGKVYVLINGGSFSNTAIVCSRLAYYRRCVFVGEETAGNSTIISGFASDEAGMQLQNTHINCTIPNTAFLIRADAANKGHGTMPGYAIKPSINDVIENNDVVKKFAIRLIEQNR